MYFDRPPVPVSAARPLTRGEHIADLIVNTTGFAAGLIGAGVLLVAALSRPLGVAVCLAVYGVALAAVLGCSMLYNAGAWPDRRGLLRRIDHALIFVLTAATYTPFLVVRMTGAAASALLIGVWSIAAAGAAIKLLALRPLEGISIALYLLQGWSILLVAGTLVTALTTPGLVLLLGGGVFYTLGVGFYLWERLPFQQPIWHGFVLAGAACHYAAICHDIAFAAA